MISPQDIDGNNATINLGHKVSENCQKKYYKAKYEVLL